MKDPGAGFDGFVIALPGSGFWLRILTIYQRFEES
jgi:hypothetical protein